MISRILIVEDDKDFATSLELALGLIKRSAVVASTTEEALAVVGDNPGKFRIGFFDIKLPGENGIACLQKIRSQDPDFVGVIMTGFRDEELFEQARNAGATEILLKPFRMVQFMELAEKFTDPN